MIRTLYSLGIGLYRIGVYIAALRGEKPKQMIRGWKQLADRDKIVELKEGPTAWFHAASLGEFEQARPVIETFHQTYPEYKICVTFFSPSGYEMRKTYELADFICYLPMDTRSNAHKVVELINPSVAFFVKYDFWFNYLDELRKHNVPTYIFSSIFRPNQYFFTWYGRWFRKQLGRCFKHMFVQNEESVQLLNKYGITQCSIAGDTRFDRVHAIVQAAQRCEEIEQWLTARSGKTIIAGSSWEPDEQRIKRYLDRNGGPLKIVLAPHVISSSHIENIEALFGKVHCQRYSQLDHAQNASANILIIDNMGMLSKLYRYADIAYIGGGWGHGIHNILEAVTFGKPVIFGPNYHKFKEARDMISRGGAYSYTEDAQLKQAFDMLLNDPEAYCKASLACTDYMEDNLGATQKIMSAISVNATN